MLFTSPIFLFAFLPLTYLGFVALRQSGGGSFLVPWLLVASMVFYAWWSPVFLLFLIASMVANYWVGRAIEAAEGGTRKALLAAGIAANLSVLGYFKYVDFFITTANHVFAAHMQLLHVILPLGISFFTFQKIAYLADIHAGQAKSGRILDFALFVFFFPQLIAGPIVHHAEMMPQFRKLGTRVAARTPGSRDIAWEDLAVGLTIMSIGLFKKVIVADQFAPYVAPVFEAAAAGKTVALVHGWQAALGYTVQLYFDFSGYSDMAIGLARMFGVRMPANFNSPYTSTSIIDFWRRWHMTLSRFLRDYLYVPLGGNRKGPVRRYVNLMIVMVLGGLWHGAGWTFVVWGGLHGSYLLIAHAWSSWGRLRLPAWLAWLTTIMSVIAAWVVFRAADLASAGNVLGGMLGLHGVHGFIEGRTERPEAIIFAAVVIVLTAILPNSQQILRNYQPVLGEVDAPRIALLQRIIWMPTRLHAALGGAVLVAVMLLSWSQSEFLYFQF